MTPHSSGQRPPSAPHASASVPDASGTALLRMAIGDDAVAVAIDDVREILEVGRLTALPRTPDFVRGVMNLRGAVVPVIDLGARLHGQPSSLSRRTCVVVVEIRSRQPWRWACGWMPCTRYSTPRPATSSRCPNSARASMPATCVA